MRNDLAGVAAALAKRGVALDTGRFEALEAERKTIQTRTAGAAGDAQRAVASRSAGQRRKGEDVDAAAGARWPASGDELKRLERELERVQTQLRDFLLELPNLPHPIDAGRPVRRRQRRGAPLGHAARVRLRGQGPRRPRRGARLLDFATAAKLAGARFTFLRGDSRACIARSRSSCSTCRRSEHGYTECYTPYIVNARDADGHRPAAEVRGRHVLGAARAAQDGERASTLYLIPTAEIPLTNIVRDEILAADAAADQADRAHAVLPLRGGQLRQGHARHDPPAPVRQGRDGADRASRASRTRRSRS